MQEVTVAYLTKTDAKFDFDYYMKKHIPLAEGLLGRKIGVRRVISSPTGSPATLIAVATIPIDSAAEFRDMLAKHGAAITADIPNYTNIEPVVQIDDVLA
jgi:uncharacterized protein (TIGR02118 family)